MIADIILLIIMVLCVFLGYKKGLIGVAVKVLGFIISLLVALILYMPVSNFIVDNTNVVSSLQTTIADNIEISNNDDEAETTSALIKYAMDYVEEAEETGVDYASYAIAVAIVRILVWIGLFIIARIVMIFVKVLAKIIEKLPIIKQFDKLGGVIYGVLEGLIIAYVALAIINVISPMLESNTIDETISNSYVCKMMYENNILLKMLL